MRTDGGLVATPPQRLRLLRLNDGGDGAQLEMYLDGSKASLPPDLLVGAQLQLANALASVSRASGALYLKADEDTAILPLWSPCTDEFCASSTSTADGGATGAADGSRAAALASHTVEATLSELASRPSADSVENLTERLLEHLARWQ